MKRVALVSFAIVLAASVIVLLVRKPEPPELVCQGKPITSWALDLNSPSPPVREKATAVLHSLPPDSVAPLIHLLRTPDPVFVRPLRAIGWRAPTKVRRILFGLIDPYAASGKRAAAAQALRAMASNAQPALHALSRALHDDQTVSWNAALALAQLGQPGLNALADALTTTPPMQCGFACYALSTQGSAASNAIPALATLFEKSNPDLGEKIASTLAAIGRPAIPSLVQALSNPDPRRRILAIRALATAGPLARAAVPKLIDATKDAETAVRLAALDALAQIQPTVRGFGDALSETLRTDRVAPVRLKAIELMSRSSAISNEVTSSLLLALRDDQHPEVRAAAAIVLGDKGRPSEVLTALSQALKDSNETVRARAEQALAKAAHRSN